MKTIFCCLFITIAEILFAGNSNGWETKLDSKRKIFIENKGQFDGRNWRKNLKIKYAIDHDGFNVFFNEKGLTYRFDKIIKNPYKKNDEDFNHDEEKNEKPTRTNISELINVTWIESDENTELIASDKTDFYFSYTIKDPFLKNVSNINYINGYNKLSYKNLYPNVDADYETDPEKGIKYTLYIHPGADISKVRMKYENNHTNIQSEKINYLLLASGNFNIKSSLGEITELKPYAYYNDTKKEVKIKFRFENDILSFDVENYDNTRELVIDPWIISATFANSTAVWEVETDSFGNIYVIGGEMPMKLQKYNSMGALQWTYSTPWDTTNVWLGTLATDNSGNSYITSGTAPEMERINSTAGLVWHKTGGSSSENYEWWSIAFNCDQTKLIVGGTTLGMFAFYSYATIFNVNATNGNILSSQNLSYVDLSGYAARPVEIRTFSTSKSGKSVFLTHKEVGAINPNIGLCTNNIPFFQQSNNHNFAYKCENFLNSIQNGGGLKALVVGDLFFYTHSGDSIYKRSLSNGSLISKVFLPGGSKLSMLDGIVVECSGLAVDNCGNVYAGSVNNVVKFDANLNILDQNSVNFTVYDICVNLNGEIIAVGAQSNNNGINRNGKIQSININACSQFVITCCDAHICQNDSVCSTDTSFTITTATSGGTWSGTGITNTSTGLFNPAIAGVGNHTIYYTLPCGTDSTVIVVKLCTTLSVCQQSNGNLSVSNGTEPYIWQQYNQPGTTPITNSAECVACGGSWNSISSVCFINSLPSTSCITPENWSIFATGISAAPSGVYPIRVTDAYGNLFQIDSLSALPNCSVYINITVTNVSCYGQTDGSATVSVINGAPPYYYNWSNGTTNSSISGLAAGMYFVTVIDGDSIPIIDTITIIQPDVITSSHSEIICSGDSILLGGMFQTTQGIYYDTLLSEFGCDSIIVSNLSVNPIYNTPVTASINQGQTYILPDNSIVDSTGIYTTILQTQNGCDSIIITNLTVLVFVYPISKESVIPIIYPNPANDKLTIETSINSEFEIINSRGQIVRKLKLIKSKNTFELTELIGGVYTVRIIKDKEIYIIKLIKQ